MKKIYALLGFVLITNLFLVSVAFGQTNQTTITISTAANSGGSFTGTAPNRVFALTPGTTNANIQASVLVTELLTNSVTITTANPGANGTGNVTFQTAVTAASTGATQRTFTVTAGGSITVNASAAINMTAVSNAAARPGNNITFNSTNGISISSAIATNAGDFTGTGGTAGPGGSVVLTSATGNISISAAITTNGGATTSGANGGRTGGAGGDVTVTATAGNVSITNTVTASGGSTNNGGSGTKTGGASGDISISGSTGISLSANLTANGGTGDAAGTDGNFSINDGNSTVGVGNTGQTAGVIDGAALTKSGTGTFVLAGTNTYTGGTVNNSGVLSISAEANLGTGAVTLTNGATLRSTANITWTRSITLGTGGGAVDGPASFTLTGQITGTSLATTGEMIITRASNPANTYTSMTINTGRVHVFNANSIGTSSVTVTGGSTLDIGYAAGTFTNVMTFQDNGNLSFRGTGTLAISTANVTFPTTGTMIFNSDDISTNAISVTGNYPALTGNLTIQVGGNIGTPGTVTLGGTLNGGTTNSLTKTLNGTLNLGTQAVTLKDLTVNAGGLTSTSGTMTLAGNFTNDGTFTHNGGLVTFTGAAAKTIGGSTATTFNGLTVNTAGGVTLNKAVFVAGTLTLSNGIVVSPLANLLTLLNTGPNVAGSPSATAHVNGYLARTGSTPFTFPMGNGTLYRPISVASLSASATVTAKYTQANPQTIWGTALAGTINHIGVCEYWELTAPAGITGKVGLNFGASCNANGYVDNPATLLVAHWSGSQWDNLGNAGATTTSVTANLSSGFSPFTIGSSSILSNPLPVKYSSLKAFEKLQGIQLDWTAYSEFNLNKYQIERSADGVTFTAIGDVAAQNSMIETRYGFFDPNPLQGISYYRVKNLDIDGKTGYSTVVRVSLEKGNKDIRVYPNPVTGGYVSLQSADLAKGNYTIKVFSSVGQEVYSKELTHNGGSVNQTIQLPASVKPGMYNMQLNSAEMKIMSKTFIVQ